MDKYEYKVRADEIKLLITEGKYAEAVKIADTIDWHRVKSVMMLCTISDLYKINRRFEESKEILLLAYDRHPGGRLIVYSLCELSIKLEEYVQAIEYYKEFVQIAPKDTGRYILQYKLYEAQEVGLEERITVLEEFKKRDHREKWAYELAYLYHRAGLSTKCAEECDEIFLWFGEGRYVMKALELKALHMPLTQEQSEQYQAFKSRGSSYEQEYQTSVDDNDASQEEGEEDEQDFARQAEEDEQDFDIQVKPVDISQYNTINLQKVLLEGIKEVMESDESANMDGLIKLEEALNSEAQSQAGAYHEDMDTAQITAMFEDTDEIKMIAGEELEQKDLHSVAERAVSSEVFFGDTAEVCPEEIIQKAVEKAAVTAANSQKLSNTGIIKTFIKPSGYDDILSQEYDGQISLVMPESEAVEKQITGQISITDVMNEWERMKKENEQKRMDEIRRRVQKQTDGLFADFDESTKTGLLEKLEKVMVEAAMKEEKNRPLSDVSKIAKPIEIEREKTPIEEPAVSSVPEEPLEEVQEVQEEAVEEVIEPMEESITEEAVEAIESEVESEAGLEAEPEPKLETETEPEIESEPEMETEAETKAKPEANDVQEEKIKDFLKEKDKRSHEETEDRELTKAEKEQFGRFLGTKKSNKQIVNALDHMSMASYTGNVIITGESSAGTIELAKELLKNVQSSDSNFSGKVAKVSGEALNKKNVKSMIDKLSNGGMIIQGAAAITINTMQSLVRELEQENRGLIVILEEQKLTMNQWLEKNSFIQNIFNLRIDLEALDDQKLVAHAKQYAMEMEYAIDDLGVLALHTRIADMQTSDHEVTVAEVEEIVEEAIYFANRKTPGHFFDILLKKRYDEEDMIILREKDFMNY